MKFKNLWKSLAVASFAVFAAVGCKEDPVKGDPTQLATPAPAVTSTQATGFTVAWTAVEYADSYTYKLNDLEAVTTTATEVSFKDLEAGTYTFKVKATSANAQYLDSEFGTLEVNFEGGSTVVFSVEMKEFDYTSFTAIVTTQNVEAFAYAVTQGATYEDPLQLFEEGTVVACEDGETPVTVGDLTFNTSYVVSFAARIAENQYVAEIPTLEFTTLDNEEAVAIYDITHREFKVRVRVPESVKEAGNVVKWGFTDLATYNMKKESWYGYTPDADFINNEDHTYHNYFINDTTFVANEENSILRDANGDPVIDEYEGEVMTYYDPIVPGQPEILLFGEFAYTDADDWGWGPGYYAAMFDYEAFYQDYNNGGVQPRQAAGYDESGYWSGFYSHEEIMMQAPGVLDASLNYDDSGLTPKGGVIRFNPDPEVVAYCVLMADSWTLYSILPYLNDNEDLLQWYVTSWNAAYMFQAMSLAGPVEIPLDEFFYIYPDETYYVLAVGLGDENGTTQCYEFHAINFPAPTLPAPTVEVTPIENPNEGDAYHVWFNVKAPNKDLDAAYYMADYIRKWNAELEYSGYNDLMDVNGNPFSDADVAAINSDEGLNVSFTSLPNYTTRLVVAGENIEGTREDLDAEGCRAIADNTTPRVTPKERVESDLFSELEGEWTATATISYQEYDYDIWDYVTYEMEIVSKVVIGNPYYPETLPEDIYAMYEAAGFDRDETTSIYENFKEESMIFEEDVRSQNRMVCLGYDFGATWEGVLTSASPYELFINPDHSSVNNAALFYDFGQKWYLEVDQEGNVTAPINSECLYPMTNWNYYYPLYMGGLAQDWSAQVLGPVEDEAWPAFPVEVADDRNTITVKPIDYYGIQAYPNVVYDYYGLSVVGYQVISEVVLTRGWNGDDAEVAAPNRQKIEQTRAAQNVTTPNRPYARTVFSAKKPVEYQVVNYNFVTHEQFEKNKENLVKMNRKN
ncbi:MAG: hypothetical protein IKV28_04705 [Bacteroidales bacterium]|nr:hypothetical protein [Bacteroidales bacterium]